MGVAAHRVSLDTFFSMAALDTLRDVPDRADRGVDPPVRSHTPATLRRPPRVQLFASAHKSLPAVNRPSDGGARR